MPLSRHPPLRAEDDERSGAPGWYAGDGWLLTMLNRRGARELRDIWLGASRIHGKITLAVTLG